MVKFVTFYLFVLGGIVHISIANQSGAPITQCLDMIPGHGVKGQTVPSPYKVSLSKTSVQGGEAVKVTLTGINNIAFKGFLATAIEVNQRGGAIDKPTLPGKIIPGTNDRRVQTLPCFGHKNSSLTHTDASPKQNLEFDWIPPNEDKTFVFLVTFVKEFKTFWVKVPSDYIQVTRNPNYLPEDENNPMDQNPSVFDAVLKELRDKFIKGCSKTKGCYSLPENCIEDEEVNCEMFTSWRLTKAGNFKFQIAGRLPGWNTYEETGGLTEGHISSGLSHDNLMGGDSVIGCVFKDGVVKPKSYFNLPGAQQNSMFQNESTGLGSGGSGKYINGFLLCEFTRTPILQDTTKELGKNFDLLKDPFHIIMARADAMSINQENKREKLGYHGNADYSKGVSERPIFLTEGYNKDFSDDSTNPENGNGATSKPTGETTKSIASASFSVYLKNLQVVILLTLLKI